MPDKSISDLYSDNPVTVLDGTELSEIVDNTGNSGAITEDDKKAFYNSGIGQVLVQKTTISSAQLLASNTTPISVVPAPGAGKVINPLSCYIKLTFNSAVYTTVTELRGKIGTLDQVLNAPGILAVNSSTISRYIFATTNAIDNGSYVNAPLVLYAPGGNPAAGNSGIIIWVAYNIITL